MSEVSGTSAGHGRSGPVSWPLLRLELRRTVASTAVPLGLALTLLVLHLQPSALPGVEPQALARLRRGLAREAAWTAALTVWIPALVFRAAATPARWRGGEWSWLGARAAGPSTALLSTWTGQLVGATALLVAVAGLVEWRVSDGASSWLFVGECGPGEVRRIEPGARASRTIRIPGPPARQGHRLRARVAIGVGGGPTTLAELEVSGGRAPARVTSQRIETRAWLEAAVPQGARDVELTLLNRGEGVLIWLDAGVQVFEPVRSESRGSLSIALLAATAVAALLAVALGLGVWMSPATAGLAALVPWWVTLAEGGAAHWLPGGGLLGALGLVAEGRCAPALEPLPLLGVGLSMLAGGVVARWGLDSQGSAR